jgi:hypothetical protein
MSLAPLDNLVRIGQLKTEPHNLAGLSLRPLPYGQGDHPGAAEFTDAR